ncbi:MAG: squalene/phytoene synthase family protein [Elusimicrobiaceae bacterium]|nr:squalene/phytoene synthase family protein [Elusimicrobiaceae bacterium]
MNPALFPILKKTSRSLYLSIRALPPRMSEAFCVCYLLCRAADSVADTKVVPYETRLSRIGIFPQLLTDARARAEHADSLVRDLTAGSDLPHEKELIARLPDILSAYDSMPAAERDITLQTVRDVCRGMTADLELFGRDETTMRAFGSAGQLDEYCHYIGGGPGLFWTRLAVICKVMRDPDLRNEARADGIGKALQITNILRDVASDLRIGRCYFPIQDIRAAGLEPRGLLQPASMPKFRPVLRKWLLWGLDNLASAEDYMRAIPKSQLRMRAAVAWPVYMCLDTLAEIAKTDNILDPAVKAKINRGQVYTMIAKTPAVLLSNTAFSKAYRLRRETLLSIMEKPAR